MSHDGLIFVLQLEEDVGERHVRSLEDPTPLLIYDGTALGVSCCGYHGVQLSWLRVFIQYFIYCGKSIDRGHLDLDKEVEAVVSPDELFWMVCGFLVWNLQNADGDNVQVVDHHVILAGVILCLILPLEGLKRKVVKLEGQVSLYHIKPSLVVDLRRQP